jgi:hypothetical protein
MHLLLLLLLVPHYSGAYLFAVPLAEPHTSAAACHAAALQALRAQVSYLKETYTEFVADSESQMGKMKGAYEVSTGRVLQLLLLWVCCNCRVLDSLQSRYVQISYCHASARSHSAYLPPYKPMELCHTVYVLIHTGCQVRPHTICTFSSNNTMFSVLPAMLLPPQAFCMCRPAGLSCSSCPGA